MRIEFIVVWITVGGIQGARLDDYQMVDSGRDCFDFNL